MWGAQTIVSGNVSLAGHRPDAEGVWGVQTVVNGNVSLAGHRPDAEGVWGVQTIVNGNVSQAEDMVADMAESAAFRTRLQQAGLGVAHVLLVSCEPLDPEELPVRLRPPRYNVSLPVQGGEYPAAVLALAKA